MNNILDQLNNCPNCGGTLDDLGRCNFCGSKVYDFTTIDFKSISSPKNRTYIKIRTGSHIIIAPVIPITADIECSVDSYPTITCEFNVCGSMVMLDNMEIENNSQGN